MGKFVGLDWARNGWFGVILTDDEWSAELFPTIWSVWKYHSDADRILIDIPIGLPSDRRRACDIQAKERLGARQRSVFYAPIRDAVYQQSLDEAKALNESQADFSIQNQTWSIVPRIREVDEFLDMYPSARDRLLETHPEVCFYALNDKTPLEHPKTSPAGRRVRRSLLAEEFSRSSHLVESCIERFTTPSYAPTVGSQDDILDALVAVVTARRPPEERLCLPDTPPSDERGLPMQILYPAESAQTRLTTLDSVA